MLAIITAPSHSVIPAWVAGLRLREVTMSTITDATRWTAVPNDTGEYYVIDILEAAPAGGQVASVTSVTSFTACGEACAATWAHTNLIAAAPLQLCMLRHVGAALPDAWFAVKSGVPRELIEDVDAAIRAAAATSPAPSPLPTTPAGS